MREIISNKIYDTDNADMLVYWRGRHDWRYALYRTKSTGIYFVHHSKRSFWDFIFFGRPQERIEPMTEKEAYTLLARELRVEAVERVFPDYLKDA